MGIQEVLQHKGAIHNEQAVESVRCDVATEEAKNVKEDVKDGSEQAKESMDEKAEETKEKFDEAK